MSLHVIHAGLANTSTLFVAALGIWAILLRVRTQPLSGGWFGALVIAEIVLIAQVAAGTILYLQGLNMILPRPFIHVLYGIVAVITLPAAYGYFGNLEDEGVKSVAMGVTCLFLWGILLRATSVAQYMPEYLGG